MKVKLIVIIGMMVLGSIIAYAHPMIEIANKSSDYDSFWNDPCDAADDRAQLIKPLYNFTNLTFMVRTYTGTTAKTGWCWLYAQNNMTLEIVAISESINCTLMDVNGWRNFTFGNYSYKYLNTSYYRIAANCTGKPAGTAVQVNISYSYDSYPNGYFMRANGTTLYPGSDLMFAYFGQNASWLSSGDTITPKYSSFINNASNLTKVNDTVNWSVTLTDETGLSGYIFAHNQTGTLTNGTYKNLSGTSYDISNLLNITKTRGNSICGQFWFNDTTNNKNQTNFSCFIVANSIPVNPIIQYPSNGGEYLEVSNINFSSYDADSEIVTFYGFINHTFNFSSITNITDWNISNGYYNLTIFAGDGYDNSSNSTVYFTQRAQLAVKWMNSTDISIANQSCANMAFNISCNGTCGTLQAWIDPSVYTYQENANETSCSAGWFVGFPCSNLYDGDWSTPATSLSAYAYYYANYSKAGGTSSLWQIGYFISGTSYPYNLTINSSCWSYDSTKLIFRIQNYQNNAPTIWSCYDGDWNTMFENPGGNAPNEEAMWWDNQTGESSKNGILANTSGTPFYVNNSINGNPVSSYLENNYSIVSYDICANGTENTFYYFYVIANNTDNTLRKQSGNLRVNLSVSQGGIVNNTCTCPNPPKEWNVSLADNCNIVSDCDIRPYNFGCYNTGSLGIYANLYTGNFTCNFQSIYANKSGGVWITRS